MKSLFILLAACIFSFSTPKEPGTTLIETEQLSLTVADVDAMFYSVCKFNEDSQNIIISTLFEMSGATLVNNAGKLIYTGDIVANSVRIALETLPKGNSTLYIQTDVDIDPFVVQIKKN